jgi:ribosomal protein S8
MGNDTIVSMITSIRNANLRRTKVVQIHATNITRDVGKKILLRRFYGKFQGTSRK